MGLFNKLFGLSKTSKGDIIEEKNYTIDIEENNDGDKPKFDNCGVLVNIDSEICSKYGENIKSIDNNSLEQKDSLIEKKEIKKEEYVYPDMIKIKDDKLKTALENIENNNSICIPIGLNNENDWMYLDIKKMPNLLIGGTVMSGKTNFINMLLISLITKYSPDEVKILLADSKGVEYSCFNGIPNLLIPVINNSKSLIDALKYEIEEMTNRYLILETHGLKKISDYNKENKDEKIPYHILFIDDYVVFSNNNENECNSYIENLSKNGWNVGIHLIIVANHPTVKILSSLSLLNFPSRLSFRVPSSKDSKLVLEASGAEKISGVGKALINSPLLNKIENVQTIMIEDEDILSITNEIKNSNKCKYINIYDTISSDTIPEGKNVRDATEEPLFDEIVDFVREQGKASTSLIQRRFRLGYNRSARAIDLLEDRGIIGPQNGSKPREVLVKRL